jgi:2-methylcitrate dehydratase PrpD
MSERLEAKPASLDEIRFVTAAPAVQRRLGALALDLAAVCEAGRAVPVARIALSHAVATGAGDQATAIFDGRRLSAPAAAWANGVLANALDLDDGHCLAKGHPGACIWPAALAAAEATGATVSDLFDAALLGYEVSIGTAIRQHSESANYLASGSWGAVGAAAAAGRLLGLRGGDLAAALAIAGYHRPAAPIMQSVAAPSMLKDAIGWGAATGVHAALLAAENYTAPSEIPPAASCCTWHVMDCYVKAHPACRWGHGAIEAALRLRRAGGFEASEIHAVRIRCFAAAAAVAQRAPSTTEEAQYSIVWPVAVALAHGRFEVGDVLIRIADRTARRLVGLCEVVVDAGFEQLFPDERWLAVEVTLTDGRRLTSPPTQARGEPADPGWEQVVAEKAVALLPDPPKRLEPHAAVSGSPLAALISAPTRESEISVARP